MTTSDMEKQSFQHRQRIPNTKNLSSSSASYSGSSLVYNSGPFETCDMPFTRSERRAPRGSTESDPDKIIKAANKRKRQGKVLAEKVDDPEKLLTAANKRRRDEKALAQQESDVPGGQANPDTGSGEAELDGQTETQLDGVPEGDIAEPGAAPLDGEWTSPKVDGDNAVPRSPGLRDSLQSVRPSNLRTGDVQRPQSAATAEPPKVVREALLEFRNYTVFRNWLETKREKAKSKREDKDEILRPSARRQFPQLAFDSIPQAFVPQGDREEKTLSQYRRLEKLIQEIDGAFRWPDICINASSRTFVEFVFEQFGHLIPSEEDIRNKLNPPNSYDYSSREEDDGIREDPVGTAHTAKDIPQDPKHSKSEGKSGESAEITGSVQGNGDVSPSPKEPLYSPRELARRRKVGSRWIRNAAKERLKDNDWDFEQFFSSYTKRKDDWLRKVQAGETKETRSEFDVADVLRGRDMAQKLAKAEEEYQAAAREANKDFVTHISTDQTSQFPWSDSLDWDLFDGEIEASQRYTNYDAVDRWIADEWQTPVTSTFDSINAEPRPLGIYDTHDMSHLRPVPYGRSEEMRATGRQRVHIDKWERWREDDWDFAKRNWLAADGDQEEARVLPPPASPRPDAVKLGYLGDDAEDILPRRRISM